MVPNRPPGSGTAWSSASSTRRTCGHLHLITRAARQCSRGDRARDGGAAGDGSRWPTGSPGCGLRSVPGKMPAGTSEVTVVGVTLRCPGGLRRRRGLGGPGRRDAGRPGTRRPTAGRRGVQQRAVRRVELADWLGARLLSRSIPARMVVPVSASQIRADLARRLGTSWSRPARCGPGGARRRARRGVDRHHHDRRGCSPSTTGRAAARGRAPVRGRVRPGLHGRQVGAGPRRGRRGRPAGAAAGRADLDARGLRHRRRRSRPGGRTRPPRGVSRWSCATPTRSPPRYGSAGTSARTPAAYSHGRPPPCRATTCTCSPRTRACPGTTTACARATWRSAPR